MFELQFFVDGEPAKAGSKSAFPFRRKNGKLGVSVVHADPKAKKWMKKVGEAAAKMMGGRGPVSEALHLETVFYLPRPQSHLDKKKDKVKDTAPLRHITRPDLTKLLRAVEDGLKGIVWNDDSQVCMQTSRKQYGSPLGVMVRIRSVD